MAVILAFISTTVKSFLPEPFRNLHGGVERTQARKGTRSSPCIDIFILPIALGGDGEQGQTHKGGGREHQGVNTPLASLSGIDTTGWTSSSWFAWDCPSFNTESPESQDTPLLFVQQVSWSFYMPLAPFPALASSFPISFPFTRSLIGPVSSSPLAFVTASSLAL